MNRLKLISHLRKIIIIDMQGTILKALSGFYYVSCDGALYECRARGSFRKEGITPLVGDRVEISSTDATHGVVEKIMGRTSCLERPPVANIDKLFIVSSHSTPSPDALLIDRLAALAVYHGIEPIIVFNKCDTGEFDKWYDLYLNAGFKTFIVSANTGQGIDALKKEMSNCISAFAGNSGVGKSSIINAVLNRDEIKTGEVSEKLGRGRHTTRHTELFEHPYGGFIADTPGFSSLEINRDDSDFKEKLPELFLDIKKFANDCKFNSCTHTCEDGCAVLEALKNGEIEASRHNSYLTIYEELKDIKPWEKTKQKNNKKR